MGFGKFGIATAAYVLVFGVFAIADDLTPAFLITAALSLLLLIVGIALFPMLQVRFNIAIPKVQQGTPESYAVRLAGSDIPMRPYIQIASCTLAPRHIPELVACAVLAVATLIVVVSGSASYGGLVTGWGLFALEGACIAGAVVVFVCLGWADECRTLRGARAILAPITQAQSGLGWQRLVYEFVDGKGDRYGGYTRCFGAHLENAVVVFYKLNNPDHNRAHRSLLFHNIRIDFVTALRLPVDTAQERVSS